jgi:hypothetical protein
MSSNSTTAESVVDAIFHELLEENASSYRRILSMPMDDDGTTAYPEVRQALGKLSPRERDHIFRIMEVIIADTASVILGTLDGTHYPGHLDGDFIVTFDNEAIQGDLQDIFIEKAEEKGIYGP